MAELLRHGCNAAIPEVDLGVDVFAFKNDRAEIARLQVKSCWKTTPHGDGSGYSARFVLPMKQLNRLDDVPALYYVLAVFSADRWLDFLVVSRSRLQDEMNSDNPQPFGSRDRNENELRLTISFREEVTCSGRVLSDCRNAWATLPPLAAPVELNAPSRGNQSSRSG